MTRINTNNEETIMANVVAQTLRQGNLADLPILEPGEFGYALDRQRLYIGNNPTPSQAGDGQQPHLLFL